MDNLNTHSPGSFYEAFDPQVARELTERLEIHYTPKHGSWLNIAECEFSVLQRQCLDRRIDSARISLVAKSTRGRTRETRSTARSIGNSPPTVLGRSCAVSTQSICGWITANVRQPQPRSTTSKLYIDRPLDRFASEMRKETQVAQPDQPCHPWSPHPRTRFGRCRHGRVETIRNGN